MVIFVFQISHGHFFVSILFSNLFFIWSTFFHHSGKAFLGALILSGN